MTPTADGLQIDGPFLEGGVLRNFVAGEWLDSDGDRGTNIDPATGESLVEVTQSDQDDAAVALEAAAAAQPAWSSKSVYERSAILRRAADLIRENSPALARMLTLEEGKTIGEAAGEIGRTAETLDVYAGLMYGPIGEVMGGHKPTEQWTFTQRVPLGVVVAISPWNFPMLLPAAKVAAALITGNSVVLKPADSAPLTMAAFVAILAEAGVPSGVVNLLLGRGSVLGPGLLRAPATAVSFTGGNQAGKVVAGEALDNGLKYQLELGGNNPVLVLEDADLDLATREITQGALGSTGQKCTATRRVFVVESLFEQVNQRLQKSFAEKRLGPGLDPSTDIGPLVSSAARDEFEASVAEAETSGTIVHRFGAVPERGFFGAPALLVDPDRTAAFVRRETFGPMVSLMRVRDYDAGVMACNETEFGLSASLFSTSTANAIRFAHDIAAGMVHVNSQTPGAEPNMPFGGMKASSTYSREMGRHGLDWFTQLKSLYVEG